MRLRQLCQISSGTAPGACSVASRSAIFARASGAAPLPMPAAPDSTSQGHRALFRHKSAGCQSQPKRFAPVGSWPFDQVIVKSGKGLFGDDGDRDDDLHPGIQFRPAIEQFLLPPPTIQLLSSQWVLWPARWRCFADREDGIYRARSLCLCGKLRGIWS